MLLPAPLPSPPVPLPDAATLLVLLPRPDGEPGRRAATEACERG